MPFCIRCGNSIELGNIFCPYCGEKVASSPVDPIDEMIHEEDFRAFVGKHAEHYREKFRNFSGKGRTGFAFTWSWSAFFLGFIWMLYRKMYLWALVAFFIAFTPVAYPLTMVGWGIVGNYLYYLQARKKIREYKSRQAQAPTVLSLSDLGGVNRWVSFVGFLFFLFLLLIVFLGFQFIFYFLEYTGFYQPEFIEI